MEKQVEFLDNNPGVALIGGAVRVIDEHGKDQNTIQYPTEAVAINFILLFRVPFAHSTICFRKEAVLTTLGGYDEDIEYAQDYDLYVRLVQNGFTLRNLPQVVLQFRTHAEAISQRPDQLDKQSYSAEHHGYCVGKASE